MKIRFTEADNRQMKSLGITRAQVLEQIEIFRKPGFSVSLSRPCTLGDGVRKIGEADGKNLLELHEKAARAGRFMKFVPASGAASRMFQSLLQIYYLPQFLEKDELYKRASQEVAVACEFMRFLESLDQFAFVDDLRDTLAQDGLDMEEIIHQGQFRMLLEYLLTKRGLNYGCLPKALLKFHSYSNEHRTAFEEQLAESVFYQGAAGGTCRLHFTVPEEHAASFSAHMEESARRLGERFGTTFDIGFSFQKSSTNTIAADMKGYPFRDRFGRLHFRPAGHGALLENLNDLQADLVYIKNIDNIVPDRLKEHVCHWKKVLGGYLVFIQEQIHALVRRMKSGEPGEAVREAARLAADELLIELPGGFNEWPEEKRRALLIERLDRPIRVCGVVPNAGEPGGAPFWVEGPDGSTTVQIVEKAQVDFESERQREIWNSSTHFNPVDIVCCTRDCEGRPFDLRKYVDRNAVIITRKSKDGKDIRALELPGLWNGSMAHWVSVFVEVPPYTFNPVKSVYDLLRPEHQPEIPRNYSFSPGV
ncbi:MAG: DUF4301 family protein [Syntrophobacteraceae bacterium]